MSSLPPLYQLLDQDPIDWVAVKNRLTSYPHEVCLKRFIEWSPAAEVTTARQELLLHHLLYGDEKYDSIPLETLSLVIDSQPEALLAKDPEHWGATPLHLACGYASQVWKQRIFLLLQKCPDATFARGHCGNLPICDVFGAYGNTFLSGPKDKIEVLEKLLEIHPDSISTLRHDADNDTKETLWEVVCREWATYLKRHTSYPTESDTMQGEIDKAFIETLNHKWGLVIYVLRRSWEQFNPLNFLPLHAFLHGRFVKKGIVLDWFLRKYNNDIKQRDEDGNLPLHVFFSCADQKTAHARITAVEKLLEAYPEASNTPNRQGRLSLHLGLENGVTWDSGIKQLLGTSTRSLVVRDQCTRFYPFMTAAVGVGSDLDTVYHLIRECPTLVTQAMENGEKIRTQMRKNWEIERAEVLAENERLRSVIARVEMLSQHARMASQARKRSRW